jgi:nucleoside-diphosphate-sugar epimerase
MKYAILGSAGQIGAHLTEYIRSQGHTVNTFDIMNFEYQDLRIDYAIDAYIDRSDFAFFLAFDVGGSQYLKSYQNTFSFIDNNVRIMTNTFRALRDLGKPFIFASSQMSNMHWSSYGALKSVGEHYCRALNSPIVKFWNVYGVEKDPKKTHVITDFVKMAVNKLPICMRTNGTEERQFLYADDCSEALYKMSQQYDKLSRLSEYHISSFEWVSVNHVAETISQCCGGATIIPSQEEDTVQRDNRNEPNRFILTEDIWTPKIPLTEGIRRIVEYETQLCNSQKSTSVKEFLH